MGQPQTRAADLPPGGRTRGSGRRGDRWLAALILVLVAPLLGLIVVAIQAESPGPAIVRGRRRGADDQSVEVLRFRTTGRAVARPTRVGAFLRRSRLETLPQLIVALRGDLTVAAALDDLLQEA